LKHVIRQLPTGISATERERRRRADNSLWEAATRDVKPLASEPPAIPPYAVQRLPEPSTGPSVHRLDLHGLTVADAHRRTRDFLESSVVRSATVVTGRSGIIRQEFRLWLQNDRRVARIEELHGGGAFRVHFRKMKP
jgi:DNA-nicking Smr family endonuclease